MAFSILTNASASQAAANLEKSTQLHQESLAKLSSGSRIQNLYDDAGGAAVSLKLRASLNRNLATQTNVSNAISFLQTQAGSLKTLSSVLSRMAELVTLMQDVTKGSKDLENYVSEMSVLSGELDKIRNENFNGIQLFITGGSPPPLTVQVSEDGLQTMDITQSDLASSTIEAVIAHSGTLVEIDPRGDSGGLTGAAYLAALEEIATLMANNGAQQSRLGFALESLRTNHVNVEAANSRIQDVDIASESGRLAKAALLVEAGGKMLSQANSNSQIALKLIQQ
jgi:flagellin